MPVRIRLLLLSCCIHSFAHAQEQLVEPVAETMVAATANPEPVVSYRPQVVLEPQIRPFITDDARVVGGRLAQVESWFRFDRESGQQWAIVAYGPNERLELSLGGVMGYENKYNGNREFSYALPLLQGKYLLREYGHGKGPGAALVLGTFLPGGSGAFKPAGYGTFGFLIATQCFGPEENVLVHANLGANYLHINGANDLVSTWGIGTQIKTYRQFHLVGELFSGDPYVPGAGLSYQLGFRHILTDLFQFDMTLGQGIGGANPLPFWFSGGIRVVTERFLKKK
ncbi:MAG TPA: hypothetical protein PKE63_02195 [Lacibacter sp.]|nr:hypothetical protein [Lacibacter sp.]HMO90435.1 hypothetical protein [Lacibacter sp.]HMP86056.1 hypothetical protein [Lacibacter sp.]